MANNKLRAKLEALLIETGKAHHTAFQKTDGVDPEWPSWYAENLHQKLSRLIDADFTKSELVYLLVLAEKERQLQAPGANWSRSYSKFFLDRFD